MARYIKVYQISDMQEHVFNSIREYLVMEGYEYVQYQNENVFKKGSGFGGNPTFFKLSFSKDTIRLETWMKYAFLPGVYVGEYGLTGIVGAAVKGAWKKRVAYVESSLGQFEKDSVNVATQNRFCSECGTKLGQGAAFCPNCGLEQPRSVQSSYCAHNQEQQAVSNTTEMKEKPISKREYRNKHVPSFSKDIRNIAILCYVCAGLSAAVCLVLNPGGVIDALILLGLALGLHFGKSKICAILILVLGIIEFIISLALAGTPSAVFWIMAGFWAIKTFHNADRDYKYYMSQN